MMRKWKGFFAPDYGEIQAILDAIDNTLASADKLHDDIERLILILEHAPGGNHAKMFLHAETEMKPFTESLTNFLTAQKKKYQDKSKKK